MHLVYNAKISKQLEKLKTDFNVYGIKAEYEAEGSMSSDISYLRYLTTKNNLKLHVKIGGVEAVNDIYNCIELEVDGIIAPMVETKFAALKFIESIKKLGLKNNPHLSINIETKTGVKNFNEILNISKDMINNITIGRSDLSKSYFNEKITQESTIINNIINSLSKKTKKRKLSVTVGGGVSYETIKNFKKNLIIGLIDKVETRKVMIPSSIFLGKKNVLNEALKFEELYILQKKDRNNLKINSEIKRLSNLATRKI